MDVDACKYMTDLSELFRKVEGSYVEELTLIIDKKPTFDQARLGILFEYWHSVKIITNSSCFWIQPNEVSSGLNAFRLTEASEDDRSFDKSIKIHSVLSSLSIQSGLDGLPFKLVLNFGDKEIYMYQADIYDQEDGSVDYKMNDEMILVFYNHKDASQFERRALYKFSWLDEYWLWC